MLARSTVFALLACGIAGAAIPADAGPKHCPPGHAKKGWCQPGTPSTLGRDSGGDRYRDRDYRRERDYDRDYDRYEREERAERRARRLERAYDEGYRDGREDGFRVGERVSRDRYRVLDRDIYYDRYGSPLDDRYTYAEIDGRQVLIEAATNTIIDILSRR